MIKVNLYNNIYQYKYKPNVNFCGEKSPASDSFERQTHQVDTTLKIYDPYTSGYSSANINIDLEKPQKLVTQNKRGIPIELDYDPARTDFLYDKINKKPIKTVILKSIRENRVSYNFMSENLDQEYGYMNFTVYDKKPRLQMAFDELFMDYPNQGITGPRLVVDYVQNWNDKSIGGIGHLADKLTVQYCAENNLPFNIVSVADRGSHMAHYIRGKRFLPLEPDSYTFEFYKKRFGQTDINEILKELLETIGTTKKKIKPDIGFIPMYMPQELVQKYLKELLLKR